MHPRFPQPQTRAAIVDAHVAAFARGARVAVIDAAIENNAGANARSDRGVENVAEPAGRAPARFRQRGGVGVVVHFDGHAILRRDSLGQRKIPPAGKIRRIENHPGLRVEGPGGADADALNSASGSADAIKESIAPATACKAGLGRAVGDHRLAALREDLAVAVHQSDGDLCAADIDAENGTVELWILQSWLAPSLPSAAS